jgi:hypothetical protein
MEKIKIHFTTTQGMTALLSISFNGEIGEGRQKALDHMAKHPRSASNVYTFSVESKHKTFHYSADGRQFAKY